MAKAVMGLFEDQQSAEKAVRELEAQGVARQDIEVRSGSELSRQLKSERAEADEEGGVLNRIRNFFRDIGPSSRRKSAKKKASKEQPGAEARADSQEGNLRDIKDAEVLIIVNAADDQSADQAADIMEEYGVTDTEAAEPACVRVYSVVVETVEAVDVPMDESAPAAGQAAGAATLSPEEQRELTTSEREFQNEWQATRAGATGLTSDQVLPGYQYGYLLGRSPQHSTAEWSAVEPTVQRDWDERRYGPREHLREAVRSGWERAHHRQS